MQDLSHPFPSSSVSVSDEAAVRVDYLQEIFIGLCSQYERLKDYLDEPLQPGESQHVKNLRGEQESEYIKIEMRRIDKLMKEAIIEGLISPSTSSQLPMNVIKSPPVKKVIKLVHPSAQCNKEEFLNRLGLLSQEALELRKQQLGKVERRRRTATINPKYISNGFLKFDELTTRRSKRLESVSYNNEASTSSDAISSSNVPQRPLIPCCFVCYGTDYNIQCESCTTKFHYQCIKLTASCSPKPHRLPICPKCVQAANVSQRVRIQNRCTKPLPSIMKGPKPATKRHTNRGSGGSKTKRSISTSEIEKSSSSKSNRSFGASKNQIEAVGPKAKVHNGNSQSKSGRIAKVKLNMRRSSDEPSRNNNDNDSALNAPIIIKVPLPPKPNHTKTSPVKNSSIKWRTKLKARQVKTYSRKRSLPETITLDDETPPKTPKPCENTENPCGMFMFESLQEQTTQNFKENEENNSLLASNSSIVDSVDTTSNAEEASKLAEPLNDNIDDKPQTSSLLTNNTNNINNVNNDENFDASDLISYIENGIQAISLQDINNSDASNSQTITHSSKKRKKVMTEEQKLEERKRKRRARSLKAKAEMQRTMLAMTAAAKAVLSMPETRKLEIVDESWPPNDHIIQSISTVSTVNSN